VSPGPDSDCVQASLRLMSGHCLWQWQCPTPPLCHRVCVGVWVLIPENLTRLEQLVQSLKALRLLLHTEPWLAHALALHTHNCTRAATGSTIQLSIHLAWTALLPSGNRDRVKTVERHAVCGLVPVLGLLSLLRGVGSWVNPQLATGSVAVILIREV
jgi:hypothetical protein